MAATLGVQLLRPGACPPARMTEGAAGFDLSACLGSDAPIEIPPGGRVLVPTGVALAIPPGMEGQIRPRSGLALRHGVTVLNAPGTIDADYRGEVRVLLVNLSDAPYAVADGERVAQLVVASLARVVLETVEVLAAPGDSNTPRDPAGFGTTGGFGGA